MNVHLIYFYGFVIYCISVVIIGAIAAFKKDDWNSRTVVILQVIFGIFAGAFILVILALGTPDGSTWP